ncbi:MAG: malonate transporter subunit MadM [Cytophagaceae bacterium]|nr:malonate transporter subunit MadM [Cytophagaceae bacterium]
MKILEKLLDKNGLVAGILVVAVIILFSELFTRKVLRNKIPSSALAILMGLVLAYLGGLISNGEKGLADIEIFKGVGVLGGAMFRDFSIVASSLGASFLVMKRAGILGLVSLFVGITFFFICGVAIAYIWGYRDAVSLCTIGAGACTYIVGPVTGAALNASSDVIALSIATGVVKAIGITILTPVFAPKIGLNNPEAAMAYGGLMGTNSGVAAGLAATDPALVPYGTVTATFYTGLGCLVCPSLFYLVLNLFIN